MFILVLAPTGAQEKIMVNLQATYGELVRLNRFLLAPAKRPARVEHAGLTGAGARGSRGADDRRDDNDR